jgi:hypothetical protein
MTSIIKQKIINKFVLPKDVINIIKEYIFHTIKKIQKNDPRYDLLLSIPLKEYDFRDGVTFLYLTINEDKDYFITYKDFEIQIQTLRYVGNAIYGIDGHHFLIE